jgi:hypothetical protein
MDVSVLRQRIMRALDDARKDAAAKRANGDKAAAAYQAFLSRVATPLFRNAATVLKAETQPFTLHTPAGSIRLASDHGAQDFLELDLDASGEEPQVIGRVSRVRGSRGVVVEERPIAPGKAIDALTEEDVSAFLLAEIPKLVMK